MSTTTATGPETEATILARVFGDERGELTPEMARHILGLGFSDRDKARIQDLGRGIRKDKLSEGEKEEMLAFSKAGTILSILKSRARRTLGVKLEIPTY